MRPLADSLTDENKPPRLEQPKTHDCWFSDFYRQHIHALCRHLRVKYGPGPPEPEDIAQEIFSHLAALPRVRLQTMENPKGFLYRAAENALISAKRRARVARLHASTIKSVELERSEFTPERVVNAKDQLEVIERVLRSMPEKRRRCFVMHRFDELSFTEIGHRSGMSANGAKKHVERAMRDIADALNEAKGQDQ